MVKIEQAVEHLLANEPHLTRAEAIKFITSKADKKRSKKISKEKRKQTLKQLKKGKVPVKSVGTISGGKVSPK